MKRRRSIANPTRKISTTQLLKLGSKNRPTRFWKRCKKSRVRWEESGSRPHLNPLPRGEEDTGRGCLGNQGGRPYTGRGCLGNRGGRQYAKRQVRARFHARLISICYISAANAAPMQCCNCHTRG